MSEGIIIADERRFIRAANPMPEQIFGYEKSDFVGNQMKSFCPTLLAPSYQFQKTI